LNSRCGNLRQGLRDPSVWLGVFLRSGWQQTERHQGGALYPYSGPNFTEIVVRPKTFQPHKFFLVNLTAPS
jgi:hypothetical protein